MPECTERLTEEERAQRQAVKYSPTVSPHLINELFRTISTLRALAEEKDAAHEELLQEAWLDSDVHPRCGYGSCERCDGIWDRSIAALALTEDEMRKRMEE